MPTVLITGANRGIGLALARGYAAEGWRVHACCRHPDKARDLKTLKEGSGDRVAIHRLDVTDGLKVANLSRELAGEAIDVLINNAGVGGPRGGFGETDFDRWQPVFAVNTFAPLRMAERFVEQVARGERKLIVNISSKMGSIGANVSGDSIIYRASKAALNQVSKCLSVALAPRGITVILFHPGWVSTDMGGSEAPVAPEDSAAGMRAVIAGVTAEDNGRFFNYDGEELPW
ncbi:MAG: SDR family oxidoreductase [Proteobacteria bacterium]|nr:SDR family oxidoreductase [Pseudomonadota bacterium]